jgi:hypothetical protein
MDIYPDSVYANLTAYESTASHALFADVAGYSIHTTTNFGGSDPVENLDAARHQSWLFRNELLFSSCPTVQAAPWSDRA